MEAGERGGGQNVLQSMIGEHFPSAPWEHFTTMLSPGIKNLPFDAGNVGSILGQGTKNSQARGQLSLSASRKKPAC